MCGIFGWIGGSVQQSYDELLERQFDLLYHRGPDDQGFEAGPEWALSFRRLSILDLSPLGHQPMSTPDRRSWLVFNGEIYNYLELREALEREGERFHGGSDTEVLLRMLQRDGSNALEHLNGMFALAMVDTGRRVFLLARDRFGEKPLYYRVHNGQLRFASELKALLAWPDAPRQVDPAAVVEYLTLGYLSNETCIFKDYHKLPPGHLLIGSLDAPTQFRILPYWHLELNAEVGGGLLVAHEYETLLNLLADAVRIRLRSDVPVGVFLSGGIDSGLVAALAGTSGGASPLALTVGYSEDAYDETSLARATAECAGLEHRVIPHRSSNLADVDVLAWFFDEPFGDASALPTFALCQVAAQYATVFLAGDGGDEAFGGYRRYIEAGQYKWLTNFPAATGVVLRSLAHCLPTLSPQHYRMLKSSLPDAGFAAAFDGIPGDPAIRAVLHAELRPFWQEAGQPVWKRWARSKGQSLLARQQALDYSLYLPDDILVKIDRASMAHSIEVRSPFLDYRVVEWAARLPRQTLLNAQHGKLPLRTLGERLLPTSVQHSAKRGFGVPLDTWFRQTAGQQFLHERLLSEAAHRFNFWDPKGVERIIMAHQSQRGRDFGNLLWRILMLDAWARHYLHGTAFLAGPPSRKLVAV
jgi:asparagine synthase (glutamine-hydrolysing)